MEKNITKISNGYMFDCPHCSAPIQVNENEVNCRIFRHGQYKNTYVVRITRTGVTHVSVIIRDGNVGETVQFKNPSNGEYESAMIVSVHSGGQVPPHSSKIVCDQLFDDGLIWGCSKPFQLSEKLEYVTECEYI